jgi:hypothetical protein
LSTVERAGGYYEVQEVEFGRVYIWRPEHVVVECECGESLSLTRFKTTCRWCEVDHAATVWKELSSRGQPSEEVLHPWRYAREREGVEIPF